jgi:pimeloyl-ACP methyl ester carboxylesterase
MTAGHWLTGRRPAAGFEQFWRDWRPNDQHFLPVLALHGSLTQSGMWLALAEAVRSIRMLCPDQRGFGLSGDPGSDVCADFAADALALAREHLPAGYVVMGHSFACSIALEVALRAVAQIAGVVLVDPVVRVGSPPPAAPPPSIPESFATRADAERHFRETEEGVWTDATVRRFVDEVMLHDDERGPWRMPYTAARLRRLRAFTASPASDFGLFAKAEAVRCPVLVFRGGLSKRFPAAAEPSFLGAFSAPAELVVCPTSGHFPSATEPGLVIDALKAFLAGVSLRDGPAAS